MKYTFYNPSNGQITGVVSVQSDNQLEQMREHHSVIPGAFDGTRYRIVDNVAVELPPNPSDHIVQYQFNFETLTWEIDTINSEYQSRQHRNLLLTAVDRVNPVWFNSLTTQQQSELAEYRLALLAVPQHSGFPTQVNWPAKPTWI